MARKSENGFRALLPVHRFQRSNMNLMKVQIRNGRFWSFDW